MVVQEDAQPCSEIRSKMTPRDRVATKTRQDKVSATGASASDSNLDLDDDHELLPFLRFPCQYGRALHVDDSQVRRYRALLYARH